MISVSQGGRAQDPEDVTSRLWCLNYPGTLYNAIAPAIGGVADTQGVQYGSTGFYAVVSRNGAPGDVYGLHQNRPCVRIPPSVGASLQSVVNFPIVTLKGGAGSRLGGGRLFGRLQFDIARSAVGGTDGQDQGVMIGLRSAGSIGLASVNGFLFGLAGDGAGGWRWISSRGGGVLTETVPVVWPVATNLFCTCELRVYSATDTLDGRAELWVNGARVISRSFAGALLPPYTDVANQIMYGFTLRNAAAGANDLLLSGVRYILSAAEDLG